MRSFSGWVTSAHSFPVDPARSPDPKKLMEVLGVYRWVPVGLADFEGENDLDLVEGPQEAQLA
jgi:hypothetical protein